MATDRAALSITDPLSWTLQLGLAASGNLIGYAARTGLRMAGVHFASILTFAQVLTDEGTSALVTQNFRRKDGSFWRRYGYELTEGLIARGFLHFGLRIFHQLIRQPNLFERSALRLVATGLFLAVGGILGEQATQGLGSVMPTTPWNLTGFGLRFIDSQVGMLKGGALRSLPVLRHASLDDWGRRLEERYGVEPYLNRLFSETRLVLTPETRAWFDKGYMAIDMEHPRAPRSREEFFLFLTERLRNIGGLLHLSHGKAIEQGLSEPWRFAYQEEGTFSQDPGYYDGAVAILKMIRRAEQRGWNILREIDATGATQDKTRIAFDALKNTLGNATIPFRIDHYFPPGTQDRKWFELGWSLEVRLQHPSQTPAELGIVLRERLRNTTTSIRLAWQKRWHERPEHREQLQNSVPRLRAIVSLIEDMEAEGHMVMDINRIRLARFIPLSLREETSHRHDPEHLAEDVRLFFQVERETWGRLMKETEGLDVSALFGRQKRELSERGSLQFLKQFLAFLENVP